MCTKKNNLLAQEVVLNVNKWLSYFPWFHNEWIFRMLVTDAPFFIHLKKTNPLIDPFVVPSMIKKGGGGNIKRKSFGGTWSWPKTRGFGICSRQVISWGDGTTAKCRSNALNWPSEKWCCYTSTAAAVMSMLVQRHRNPSKSIRQCCQLCPGIFWSTAIFFACILLRYSIPWWSLRHYRLVGNTFQS